MESALLAAAVAATSALIVFSVFLCFEKRWKRLKLDKNSGMYFLLAGFCTAGTDVLDITVLSKGNVSFVAPLLATSPLFTIALSAVFLRGVERISWSLVSAAVLILVGMEVILIFGR
jgi:uncharacterized membrane protein